MGFASYTENIIERVVEAKDDLYAQLNRLRAATRGSDSTERNAVAKQVREFETDTARTLDAIENSIANVFGDLLETLRDPNFQYAAKIKKIELQRNAARTERDDALSKRDKTRKTNADLIQERDDLMRKNARLSFEVEAISAELKALRKKLVDQTDWNQAVKDVVRR